jgi:GntR family transcriptional regulator
MNPRLFLSASDGSPMYQQVIDQITALILAGTWPAGAPLPSIRELASANQVSVITVKRAYEELERSGVIVTRHGKGSFVAESLEAPRAMLREELDGHIQALLTCAQQLGLTRKELQSRIDATPSPAPGRRAKNQ